jgi:hypothetical protein
MLIPVWTKYLGATNYRGSRIVAQVGQSPTTRITISYPYEDVDPHEFAAMEAVKRAFNNDKHYEYLADARLVRSWEIPGSSGTWHQVTMFETDNR